MSTLTHPVFIKSNRDITGLTQADGGTVACSQTGVINQNSTSAVDLTFKLPPYAQIVDFVVMIQVAFDSATSAVLSIGTSTGATTYYGSGDVKTAGGLLPNTATHITVARALAMANITTNTTVVATVTPTGATTVGQVRVTVRYAVASADGITHPSVP